MNVGIKAMVHGVMENGTREVSKDRTAVMKPPPVEAKRLG
jgi:hypothetical protein